MLAPDKTRINFALPKELFNALKDACYWERTTITNVMLKATEKFVEKASKKPHHDQR